MGINYIKKIRMATKGIWVAKLVARLLNKKIKWKSNISYLTLQKWIQLKWSYKYNEKYEYKSDLYSSM